MVDYETNLQEILPPIFHQDVKEEAKISVQIIREGLQWCILSGDLSIGANYYIKMLKRHLSLKYTLTPNDCLWFSQTIFNLVTLHDFDVYLQSKWSSVLTHLLKKYHKQLAKELVLPWKKLYDFIKRYHFKKFRDPVYFGKIPERFNGYTVHSLVIQARRYFSPASYEEIVDEFRPLMVPHDSTVFKAQGFLVLFLPVQYFQNSLLSEIFEIWSWIENCEEWNFLWMDLISRIAKEKLAQIDWSNQIQPFFTHCLEMIDVTISTSNLPKPKKGRFSREATIFLPHKPGFSLMAKALVYMISPQNSSLVSLKKLLKTVESYYHPSNIGAWTDNLAILLKELCRYYSKRQWKENTLIPQEHQLTSHINHEFACLILPLVQQALYSKSIKMSILARESLGFFVDIERNFVFPKLIEQFFFALETLTATHQTTSALESLAVIIGSLITKNEEYPSGVEHLESLLLASLPGIDANDQIKTLATLKVYFRFLSTVPLIEVTNSTSGSEYDTAAQTVTRSFEDWGSLFLDKIFSLLTHQEPDEKRPFWMVALFETTFKVFFMQMSQKLYLKIFQKLKGFISTNLLKNSMKEIGSICESAGYAQPQICASQIIPHYFSLFIIQNKKGEYELTSLSEDDLIWNLNNLYHFVKHFGTVVLLYKKEIEIILSFVVLAESKKVSKRGGKLLRNILFSLCNVYPLEYRSLPPGIWNGKETQHWKQWCKEFTFEEANIQWHIPNQEEIDFATHLILHYSKKASAQLYELLTPGWNFSKDDFWKYLSIYKNILRGAGVLLPHIQADFKEQESQLESKGLYSLKNIPISTDVIQSDALRDFRLNLASLLHQLSVFLFKEKQDQVFSQSQLLKVINSYFNSQGVSSNHYHNKNQFYNMLKEKYLLYSSKKKSNMRYLKVEKAYLCYMNRLSQKNFGIPLHSMNKQLLHDMEMFLTSPYPKIRSTAVKLIRSACKFIPQATGELLPNIISLLSTKVTEKEKGKVEGATELLLTKFFQTKILQKWRFIYQFVTSVCQSWIHDDINLQLKLYQLFAAFTAAYHSPPVQSLYLMSSLQEMIEKIYPFQENQFFQKNQNLIKLGYETQKQRSDRNLQSFNKTIENLLIILNSNNLHWRYNIIVSTCFLIFLSPETVEISPHYEKIFSLNLKGLMNDLTPIRILSKKFVSGVLEIIKPNQTKDMIKTESSSQADRWNNQNFNDKTHLGWHPSLSKKVLDQKERTNSFSNYKTAFINFIKNEIDLDLFFKCLAHDHSQNSEGNIRSISYQMQEQAASKLLSELIRSTKTWPYTRAARLSSLFSEENAQVWKGFFQVYPSPIELLNKLSPHFTKMIEMTDEPEYACVVSEITGGMIRASKRWNYNDVQQMWNIINSIIIDKLLNSSGSDTLSEWSLAFRFASYNLDPQRFKEFIEDKLFSNVLSGKTSSSQAKKLILIKSFLTEFTWRGAEFIENLLLQLKDNLTHPYKQVRHVIGETLSLLFENLWKPSFLQDTNQHKSLILESFVDSLVNILKKWEESDDLINEEKEKKTHFSETVLHWLSYSFSYGYGYTVVPYLPKLLPHIFYMQTDSDKDISKLALSTSALIAQAGFPSDTLDFILSDLQFVANNTKWHVRSSLLPFIQIMAFHHTFMLQDHQSQLIQTIVQNSLLDTRIEVRELARTSLSSLIKSRIVDPSSLIENFTKKAQIKLSKKVEGAANKMMEKHSGVLGLCALIGACPYDIPEWLPDVLATVAQHSSDPNPIRDTIKATFAEFWRTHQDDFWKHKDLFTEDQLNAIDGMSISPSYFA